jgi:hypothetical protein
MQNPRRAGAAAGRGQQAPRGQQEPPPQGQQEPEQEPVQVPQGPPRRARNPAKWSQLAELDFGNKQDRDYYKLATEKLEGDPYDGKNLSLFLKKLEGKAQQFNWLTLLTYTIGNPPRDKCLLNNYGEITKEDVTLKAQGYLGTDNREDQDSDMIFNCLRKSVTDNVYAQVTTEAERYTFVINGQKLVDGPSFLAAIIDDTYTNTLANTEAARENLSSLAEYMESLPDSNVEQFNAYVKVQLETLAAGGETTNDLLTNLFKGYAKVKDKTFRDWIRQKKLAYKDGTFRIHPNAQDFMTLAKKHYQDAVLSKEWMRLDEDQQTILALQTEVKEFKAAARFRKNKDGKDPKRAGKDEWKWKRIPPGENESKTKKFRGKTYNWCPNHKLWCFHKASECKLKKSESGEAKGKTGKFSKQQLRMKAYQSLFESTSEEEEVNQEESSHGRNETEGSNTSE